MSQFTRAFKGLALAAGVVLSLAGVAAAANAPAAITYHELIEGNPKAKVTIVEFASLTCPHCARFNETVLPQVKKNYVATGKVRFVYKDFPLDQLAMTGAMLARCAPPGMGMKLIDIMFKNQLEWARAEQPIAPLRAYAQLAGMSSAQVDACLQNAALLQAIKDEQNKAATLYQVEATPTFYVGDEKVSGEKSYDEFAAIIDKQLAKAK
jgi:protein-disulfide isomerase